MIDLAVEGETITTTEDHPFWSVTDQRFERADELDAGEKVQAAGGHALTVVGLELATSRTEVAFNLEVEGIHTYHVGEQGALVHNACAEPFLDDAGEAYVRAKHTDSGELRDPTKGHFYDDEDLYQLADDAADFPATVQMNGNCVRVCDTGRDIGIDAETRLPTSTYTVIADQYGGVITMHPGVPR